VVQTIFVLDGAESFVFSPRLGSVAFRSVIGPEVFTLSSRLGDVDSCFPDVPVPSWLGQANDLSLGGSVSLALSSWLDEADDLSLYGSVVGVIAMAR
jgi:hypothetical protein